MINDNYAKQSASAANKPSWNMQSRQWKDVMHNNNLYDYSKYWEDFAIICCFISIGGALAFKWLQHYVGLLQWQNTLMVKYRWQLRNKGGRDGDTERGQVTV